jgi:hypothetical protein
MSIFITFPPAESKSANFKLLENNKVSTNRGSSIA